ncbi:hypothetical protein [Rhizobium sp. BG4]|uniref:hypothetical protein n=1 Tax=Rhizobium sp. BG4 TaxID=2613770 RepID=UPI00193E9459|nr:hypothetical protein [Rhizobium sp. BG4]QRM43983.1 hypothetical protein F2982_11300 [Rhizobium sp. BG4]
MDRWLQGLVAVACVVVIAAGAYFGLKEIRVSQAAESRRLAEQARQMERLRVSRLTPQECTRMAKETIPDQVGQPARTKEYLKDLFECDDLGRIDASWRAELDKFGIF